MRRHNAWRCLACLLCALLSLPLSAAPEDFPLDPSAWRRKVNVTLTPLPADGEAGLRMDIDASDYSFGWLSTKLPASADGYAGFDGVLGRFRAPKGSSGRLLALMVLPRGGVSQYYGHESSDLCESAGQWVDFYVPFSAMVGTRNVTGGGLSGARLGPEDFLELQVTGIASERVAIEFSGLRLLSRVGNEELLTQLRRREQARRLKPEDQLDAARLPHPRLLLTPARLARMRAKATEGGRVQEAYETVIRLADGFLKSVRADAPFEHLLTFEPSKQLTPHQQRGSFEGRLVPLVRPVETLALAYRLTGDERYGRHAARALVGMARSLTVDHPQIELGFYYTRTFYVRTLALGYDWLWSLLTPEERRDVKTTLLGFVQDIHDKASMQTWGRHPLNRVWNWDPGLVSCAGLGVLAMEGETNTAEEAMLFTFRRHLRDYLTLGIDLDGCGHEGPAYLSYGIGSGPLFMECLRDRGLDDLFTATNMHLIAPWLVAETLPSRKTHNNLSDCHLSQVPGCPVYSYAMGRYAELARRDPRRPGERLPAQPDATAAWDYLRHFGETPGPRLLSYGALASLMSWAWESGSKARDVASYSPYEAMAHLMFFEEIPPCDDPASLLPQGMLFRGRGLAVSRDGGYATDGLHLAVEAGPHAGGHDQADKGTFTLRAYGADLFIDSGYGNDGNPLGSGSAFAHNVVLCDGEGQPCKWHNNSNGHISGYHTSPRLDWIRVDALEAWNLSLPVSNYVSRPSGRDMALAERQLVLVRGEGQLPPYLVVHDSIARRDGQEHDFTWQWHHPARMLVDASSTPWLGRMDNSAFDVLTTDPEPGQPWGRRSATFTFRVPRTGDYRLVGLTFANGDDPGKSDSFSVEAGGVRIGTWDSHGGRTPSWSEVRERGEVIGRRFSLEEGASFEVRVISREPQSCLTRLALIPFQAPLPSSASDTGPGSVCLGVDDAVPGETPLLRRRVQPPETSDAQVAVYPVGNRAGKVSQGGYLTSKEGSHGRLQYTVRAVNPHFVMVIVPKRQADAIQPQSVEPLPDGQPGALVIWPGGRTDRIELPPSQAGRDSRTLRFTRSGGNVPDWGWRAADADATN